MKKRGLGFIIAVVFIGIIGIILAYRIYQKSNPVIFQTNEDLQRQFGVPVEVIPVARHDLVSKDEFTGSVEGFAETLALSDLTQKVVAVKVKVGDRVSKKDTLVVLDKKSVSNMNVKYDHALVALNDAKVEFERVKRLYKAGAVTKQTYDKAKLNFEINKANFEAITSAIYIGSPIAGIVTEVYVEPGDKVGTGRPVAKVVQFGRVKIKLQISEAEIGQVRVGQKCLVRTSSFDRTFAGRVTEIDLSANPASRTFKTTVVVPNPDLLLRSGMFATVTIIFAEKSNVLAVPKESVEKADGERFVYTVSSDSLISKRPVGLGAFDGEFYEITSGLQEGEWVIVSGQNNIQMENQKAIVVMMN